MTRAVRHGPQRRDAEEAGFIVHPGPGLAVLRDEQRLRRGGRDVVSLGLGVEAAERVIDDDAAP